MELFAKHIVAYRIICNYFISGSFAKMSVNNDSLQQSVCERMLILGIVGTRKRVFAIFLFSVREKENLK